MQLIGKELYERRYEEVGVENEKKSVFMLKKISFAEKSAIDDASMRTDKDGVKFLNGTWMRMKIKYALVDWKNVTDALGKEVPCTEENKDNIPYDVAMWIVNEIDKLNGIGLVISEEERKNS